MYLYAGKYTGDISGSATYDGSQYGQPPPAEATYTAGEALFGNGGFRAPEVMPYATSVGQYGAYDWDETRSGDDTFGSSAYTEDRSWNVHHPIPQYGLPSITKTRNTLSAGETQSRTVKPESLEIVSYAASGYMYDAHDWDETRRRHNMLLFLYQDIHGLLSVLEG